MAIFFLAKNGYGTVDQLQEWDSAQLLDALEYESMCNDIITYEQEKASGK